MLHHHLVRVTCFRSILEIENKVMKIKKFTRGTCAGKSQREFIHLNLTHGVVCVLICSISPQHILNTLRSSQSESISRKYTPMTKVYFIFFEFTHNAVVVVWHTFSTISIYIFKALLIEFCSRDLIVCNECERDGIWENFRQRQQHKIYRSACMCCCCSFSLLSLFRFIHISRSRCIFWQYALFVATTSTCSLHQSNHD